MRSVDIFNTICKFHKNAGKHTLLIVEARRPRVTHIYMSYAKEKNCYNLNAYSLLGWEYLFVLTLEGRWMMIFFLLNFCLSVDLVFFPYIRIG